MQTVPFSEEFERAIICGVLSDPQLLPRVTTIVSTEDFYKERHRDIWDVILSTDLDNLDSLAIEERLKETDTRDYFKQLVNDSDSILPGLSNILFYAETIKDKARLRRGIDLGREIAAICSQDNISASGALERLESMFSSFIQTRVRDNSIESTKDAFLRFIEKLGERIHNDEGTKTGFKDLDLILHKLEGLIILAARPSVGKTGLAVNIIRNVGETKPVVFFSLEQPKEQIFERMLSAESNVPHEELATGAFIANPAHVESIAEISPYLTDMFERNIHVDDTPNVTSAYIASVARQKHFEHGELGLIVVDYLHIMQLDKGALVETLGTAVKELRALGRELGCPVLLLAQLSRQPDTQTNSGDSDKKVHRRPELSDLRSSGEIEQTADIVLFLHRESYYDPSGFTNSEDDIEVIVRKNRNGRTGITTLLWYPAYMKYMDRSYLRASVGESWSG